LIQILSLVEGINSFEVEKMLTLTSKKSLILGVIILVLLILFILLPIEFEYKLKVQGKLLPSKEWILYKGTDGRLTSLLTDYREGINKSYDVTLFDRGDVMEFEINQSVRSSARIELNDTIAKIYSNENERLIENLKGQIAAAKASLSANITGEKEAIIMQEKNNLDFAIKQAEEQKRILERIEALYKKGLASQEEYEIAKNTYDLYEINILISKSRLESVETGAKQETLALIKSQINALESELAVLKKRSNNFVLLSPINGYVNRKTNSDTLLIISDTSQYVLLTPIKIADKKFISPPQKVDIYINRYKQSAEADLVELNNMVQLVNGLQVVTAVSIVQQSSPEMIPGLMVDAYIHTGSLSPLKYFLRVWQRLVN
jgi:hypothetical protein